MTSKGETVLAALNLRRVVLQIYVRLV